MPERKERKATNPPNRDRSEGREARTHAACGAPPRLPPPGGPGVETTRDVGNGDEGISSEGAGSGPHPITRGIQAGGGSSLANAWPMT